ncbi:MAG TPA: hypothetical protein VL282_06395 [Tepidisphaeraceae bacterium]|nr:hypothetical protein [Tepidisphaeraceae bacterium]
MKLDPLEYRFRAVSGKLVAQIFNPTTDKIQLRGSESYVVDPKGQSHPLRSMSIAPNSFGKVIIPPSRPVVYDSGPYWGIGVGTTIGEVHHHHDVHCKAMVEHPVYLMIDDDDDSYYWDLSGEGELRMHFEYQRGDKIFYDDFVLRRVKM